MFCTKSSSVHLANRATSYGFFLHSKNMIQQLGQRSQSSPGTHQIILPHPSGMPYVQLGIISCQNSQKQTKTAGSLPKCSFNFRLETTSAAASSIHMPTCIHYLHSAQIQQIKSRDCCRSLADRTPFTSEFWHTRMGWCICTKLAENHNHIWRKHVWAHGEPLSKPLKQK